MQTKYIYILYYFMLISVFSFAQEQDTRYQDLKVKIDSIRIDSTTFSELFGAQLDEIVLDYKQINDALKIKIDSLNNSLQSIQNANIQSNKNNQWLFYGSIGFGALTFLFFILFIIFLMKSSKKQKQLKQANFELGKLKAEVDKLNNFISTEKEQHQYAIELIENEKTKLLSELKRISSDYELLKQNTIAREEELNKKIGEISQSYNLLKQENDVLKAEVAQQIAKIEETAQVINELKEDVLQKTTIAYNADQQLNDIRQKYHSLMEQVNEYQKEIEMLKEQIIEANETKEKVNNELKKFVEELQTMLPLPKN